MTVFSTALALLALPIALGALLGSLLRRLARRHFAGVIAAIACLILPAALVVGLGIRFPLIGLWDTAVESLLFALGVLLALHSALSERRNLALLSTSLLFSLLLLELATRLFLPPPPAFPVKSGPHLLLADALRVDLKTQPWDTRCKEVVCSVVYGDQYPGIFDPIASQREIVTPQNFVLRPDAQRRVLHIGDSMAFGFGLPRDQTFTADLERLEPGIQHINGSIPGTAPDAYLAVLQSWIVTQKIDLAVMYVYEGNDLEGLDSRYPCCDWQSLLTYDASTAHLRCQTATVPDLGHAGVTWLRYHNPPPYLLRALVGTSSAATYLAAATTVEPFLQEDQSRDTRLKHLGSILRTAGEVLTARGIPFLVVVLPARSWLESSATRQHDAVDIVDVARRDNVRAIDASAVFRDAVEQRASLFFENGDIHFNAAGHTLLATWLHERLPPNGSPTDNR
ncbi:MAG: hypothetical protein HY270_03615 [Deltaproteobacteria bacterium]|nr:hypothetical protein [Deltaproteobacteria bacterium]